MFTPQITKITSQYKPQKKIPVKTFQDWIKTRFNIPQRTFLWYVQEGLLPRPVFKGREGFYNFKTAEEIEEKIYILIESKAIPGLTFSPIRKLFRKFNSQKEKLLQCLIAALDEYPIKRYIEYTDEIYFNEYHQRILRIYFKYLLNAKRVKYVVIDIDDRVREVIKEVAKLKKQREGKAGREWSELQNQINYYDSDDYILSKLV